MKNFIRQSLFFGICTFLIYGCSNNSTNPVYDGKNIFADNNSLLKSVISDVSNGSINLDNYISQKIYAVQNINIIENNIFFYGRYRVNGNQGKLSSVECFGYNMELDSLDNQYYYKYYKENFPEQKYNVSIRWNLDFGNEIVRDTCVTPNDIGNTRFSTDSFDLTKGGIITWDNPDTGCIALSVRVMITGPAFIPLSGSSSGNLKKIVKDNGSYQLTSDDLLFFKDFLNTSDKKIEIKLQRFKYQLKSYDNNSKYILDYIVANKEFIINIKR